MRRRDQALSLTLDGRFDAHLRAHQDQNPARLPVATIEDLAARLPDRILPIFRLLGTAGRPTAAVTRPIYLQRRPRWRFALQAFAGLSQGSPLLFLGFGETPSVVIDLASELQAVRAYKPQAFCFLIDDPVLRHADLVSTLETFGKVAVLDVALDSLGARLTKANPPSVAPAAASPLIDLRTLGEYVHVVGDHLTPTAAATETNRLLDLLASPVANNWDPFAHDLDLPRTVTGEIAADLRSVLSTKDFRSQVFVISGAAATGKTTILKRLAFDLAKSGRHVLWLRPVYASDAQDIVRRILKIASSLAKRIVVVMDDPVAFPSLTPSDVAAAASAAQLPILLLTACRTTDRVLTPENAITGGLPIAGEIGLSSDLDAGELALLPDYLHLKLRLAADATQAMRLLPLTPTTDVLSLLHFLLPSTRPHIEESVKDEYFRLGDSATLGPAIAGAYRASGVLLQHAYRLVAIATYYRAPLPLEILVQALNVSISDWLEAVPMNSPAWGLLYPDQADPSETPTYRARNQVIADGLRRLVNGGSINRSGEVEVLAELLAVANGTQSVYREFAVKTLVHNPTFDDLSFNDGLRLFDTALSALPFEERTILHHKARWIRKRGPNVMEAFAVLDQALAAPQNSHRGELDELIHTSYARTILTALEQDRISVEAAKNEIAKHIDKASSDQFINIHATHINAETTLELLSRIPKDTSQEIDRAVLTTQALEQIDRTIQLVKHGSDTADVPGDLDLLEVAQAKLVETVEYDAEAQWVSVRSQAGYVATALRLLATARTRAKGTEYNLAWQYVNDAIARIVKDGGTPSRQLHEAAATIYYRWRIQRAVRRGSEPIDWSTFQRHVEAAIQGIDTRHSALYRYMSALAFAHQNRWAEANAIFQKLRTSNVPRQVVHLLRDYLLTTDGAQRRVQGTIKAGPSAIYFVSSEIATDCPADRAGPWPMSESEPVHAHIRFSMAGPRAFRSL